MRILVAGIIGRHPFGGVGWCSLMYLLGFAKLGHEVRYVEDTGECVFDPVRNALSEDPGHGLATIAATLGPHGFGDAWTFVNYDGAYHGRPRAELVEYCRDADLFVNLSGGSWFWRDEYARIPRRVFIDSDPVFTQRSIASREPSLRTFFTGFDHLFTFGANIGTRSCDTPTSELTWHHTWQPIDLEAWAPLDTARDRRFTSVMTWRISSFAEIGGNKDQEFVNVIDLPARVGDRFDLALNGPHDLLAAHGWRTRPAMDISRTAADYREFIRRSYAEFGVAKHTYVAARSGWFSDRTACYLASGRPAIVQRTGWEDHLPAGAGLFGFSTIDDIPDAIEAIDGDYERHRGLARDLAAAHFDGGVVLRRLLDQALR